MPDKKEINKKIKEKFEKLCNEVFTLRLRWKVFQAFLKILQSNEKLQILSTFAVSSIWNAFMYDLAIGLRRTLLDKDPRSISLLSILYDLIKKIEDRDLIYEAVKDIKNLESKNSIFWRLKYIVDKYIAHYDEGRKPQREIPLPDLFKKQDELIRKWRFKIIGKHLVNSTPVVQEEFQEIFTVPWLKGTYPEPEKLVTIVNVDYSYIKLSNGYTFFVDPSLPKDFRWEKGDEIVVFESYNYNKVQNSYILCNLTKKQWIKATHATCSGSWVWIKLDDC